MRFNNWSMPEIKDRELTKWNWLVLNKENLELGKNTDIGAFSLLQAEKGIVIEDEVELGSHCSVFSTSTIDGKSGKVTLKKGCKIGSHSVIMPGITVGERSIIGAMSLVNKDIPEGEIWIGSPAKFLRKITQ